jgi:DNA polymerase
MRHGLTDLLLYLRDIGYGDLYLAGPAPAAAGAAASGSTSMGPVAPVAMAGRGSSAGGNAPGADLERAPALPPRAPRSADPDSPEAKQLAAVCEAAQTCTRCRLAEGRNKVVFGSGPIGAELMFIGEGPGAEEDKQGLPFVGRAGELLTKIVGAMEMRREDVYIANIVKCRPPGNRDPQPDEVAACGGYLEKQIALVAPKVIVALGRIAAQALLGTDTPIGRMRGQWYQIHGVPTMVTYHPAALLRNPALKRPTWEDMQQVRDRLRG